MLRVLILPLLFMATSASAELVVIYDTGRTVPLKHHADISAVKRSINSSQLDPIKTEELTQSIINVDKTMAKQMLAGQFPIIPNHLSAQRWNKTHIKHDRPEVSPLFIFGDDKYSLQWLSLNKDFFKKMGAVGLMTKVDSLESYIAIRKQYPDLTIYPTNADFITTEFSINVYPVLITPKGIIQ